MPSGYCIEGEPRLNLTISSLTFPAWLSNWKNRCECDISQVLGLLTKLSNG